jgi:hypothetical protein
MYESRFELGRDMRRVRQSDGTNVSWLHMNNSFYPDSHLHVLMMTSDCALIIHPVTRNPVREHPLGAGSTV